MTTPTSPFRRPRSLFSLERMRSERRVTWLTVVGILIVPLVIGGLLVWALWNPTERLDSVKAAVVNLDQPVKVGEQTVPLGRQLSAGLLDRKNDNFDWVLTDQSDAASGLADGTYTAVITIPKDFSKAATSPSGKAADAQQATIDVRTGADSKLVDPAISQAVTSTATSVLNKQLTSTYLQNVYVGFNTLHDQIAKAADGATQLAGGASQLASGTHQVADAAGQLATGASGLSSGVSQLAGGVSGLASGLSQLQQKTSGLPTQTQQLSAASAGVQSGVGQVANGLAALEKVCTDAHGVNDATCKQIAATAQSMTTGKDGSPSLVALSGLAAQGTSQLASGMPALTDGIAQSASGAGQLASGAAQSASGASQLSSGIAQLSSGLTPLASGADQTSSGAASLASGLGEAAASLPNYSSGERTNLASVVAEPVTQKTATSSGFGQSSIPLFASVALWLGALATFLVLQAVSRRSLLTSRASGRIALDGFVPAAVLGALQGVLVAGIMQFALSLDVGHWFGFAAISAATGVAFAAVNHGLVALFAGVGRFVSMLVVVITLASGIVSTVPGIFDTAVGFLPTSTAITALRGVVESTDGVWRGLGGLLLWAAFGFLLALIAVARKRVVRVTQLLPAE
ncbi:YhgE/Pip domain-containing protein [Leifsonia poae]|uniref:YhgE/Pip domain-containing protein n=1 Tax=Leifsonia poae TaxID=110933 RepID=UPI001CBEE058|nr:YhgE/Pip domain-containing protein [Leifsonia poae]